MKSPIRILLICLATAALGSASLAQTTASPDAHRRLAEAVLAASGSDARLSAINEMMHGSLLEAIEASLPNAKPEWKPIMAAAVDEELVRWNAEITQINIGIYAARFTDAELSDMLTFYQSPGGRALVAQTPAIIREKAAASQKMADGAMQRMLTSVCAKVACPADRP